KNGTVGGGRAQIPGDGEIGDRGNPTRGHPQPRVPPRASVSVAEQGAERDPGDGRANGKQGARGEGDRHDDLRELTPPQEYEGHGECPEHREREVRAELSLPRGGEDEVRNRKEYRQGNPQP